MMHRILAFLIFAIVGLASPSHGQDMSAAISTPQVSPPVTSATYVYRGYINEIYDVDTMRADIDVGFKMWRGGETLRLFATNGYEIKRSSSKGIDAAHVKRGFECRDILMRALGLDPNDYARSARYQTIDPPVSVVIETVKGRDFGKYGRLLAIVHKNGVNINEFIIRAGCSPVELYDGKSYPLDSAITPTLGR